MFAQVGRHTGQDRHDCKQEVRSSPPGLRVPVTCLSERTITVAYGRQRRTAEEAQVGASQKIKGRPADFPSW
jgi:hypothetical protein